MKTWSLIIAGALIFALGVTAGTLLAPRQSAAPPSNAASATGSTPSSAGGHSARSQSASADSGLSGDFGSRLQEALFGSSERRRDHALATLADGLTLAQIQAALESVQKLNSKNKSAVLAQLLDQWAVTDPKGAAQYAMALTRKSDRDAALAALAGGWAEADPKAAEAWAVGLQDAGSRDAAIIGLVGTIAAADPQHALTLAQGLPSDQAASCASTIDFGAWVENDPEGAAAAVAKLPPGDLQQASIEALAAAWAAQDSASAIAWVLSLGSAQPQYAASTSIASVLAPDDPEAMANLGLQLAIGHGRLMVLQAALQSWMSQDPSGALDWFQQLPADTRMDVAGEAASQAQNYAPAEAVQIALSMQPGQQQNSVLQQSVSAWYKSDPNAAMAWVQQQTDSQIKDDALQGAAASADPSTAETLMAGIDDDQTRLAAETRVATDWMKSNPAAATAWIQSSNLPQQTKDSLLGQR